MQAFALGEQQGESLRETSRALGDYRKAYLEFVDSRQQSSATMDAQTGQVSELLAQSDEQQQQAVVNDNATPIANWA